MYSDVIDKKNLYESILNGTLQYKVQVLVKRYLSYFKADSKIYEIFEKMDNL